MVKNWLVAHLAKKYLQPEGQHGFRSGRSCLTQLLIFWEKILDKLEEGKGVDVIYTDFANAFDKCETGVLLHRLRECGVLAAFLDPTVRKQSVGIEGRLSPTAHVISGVRQALFWAHVCS